MGYDLGKGKAKFDHLLLMVDLKWFSKSEVKLDSLVQSVWIFLKTIKMEFKLLKCALMVVS